MKMRYQRDELINFIDEFNEIYKNRPIYQNNGGMKSAHLFPLYAYLKLKKPKIIFESGVYRGQSTWLIRSACPESKIVSLDLNLSQRIYTDPLTLYIEKDITEIGISEIIREYDPDDVLVFFDDHQNFTDRVDFLLEEKIKNVIYEDNYPYDQGDCISPKKILEELPFTIKGDSISIHKDEAEKIKKTISHYEEFPPIFIDKKTRWGTDWSYKTSIPILDEKQSDRYPEFYSERFDYTWICYIEMIKK